jgi:beta-N-acetylhexosaminidase
MDELHRLAARTLCIGFDGLEPTSEALALVEAGVGGVILFGRNVREPRQAQALNGKLKAAAKGALLISIDHEGGRVARLTQGMTAWPSMRVLGARGDAGLAREVGRAMGRELRALNFDMDFAPVMDVDTNPANPVIGDRSLSADAAVVGKLGAAIVEGIQSAGVAACAKHFPGHGDTSQDSHLTLPKLSHTMTRLRAVELPPFQAAINAGVSSVMTAHVIFEPIDRVYPATMSKAVLDGILRGEMKFEGVVISDDMDMKAVADHYEFDDALVRGLNAGVDLFLICHSPTKQRQAIEIIAQAVKDGRVERRRLEEAAGRVDTLVKRFAGAARAGTAEDLAEVLNSAEHQAIAERVLGR